MMLVPALEGFREAYIENGRKRPKGSAWHRVGAQLSETLRPLPRGGPAVRISDFPGGAGPGSHGESCFGGPVTRPLPTAESLSQAGLVLLDHVRAGTHRVLLIPLRLSSSNP